MITGNDQERKRMELSPADQPLMDIVLQFFQEDHWQYQKIEQKPVVRAGFRGEHGTWVCYAKVDEPNHRFVFHAGMGLNIPPQYRPAVIEYLARVNLELPIGSFDIDVDSGSVRFRTGIDTPNNELTVSMVRAAAYTTVQMMDRYFSGVLSVVHSGLSPEAALARVEAQFVEEP